MTSTGAGNSPTGGSLGVHSLPFASRSGVRGPVLELDEAQQKAQNWRKFLRFCERARRRDEGLPVLELLRNEEPAR